MSAVLTARETAKVSATVGKRVPSDPNRTKAQYLGMLRAVAFELYPAKRYPGSPEGIDPTPVLNGLIASGDIVVVDGEYVGRATDEETGTIVPVSIGYDHAPVLAELYLIDHSTPESW